MSEQIFSDQAKSEFNIKELFYKYLRYWPLLAIGIAIAFTAAYLKIRYTTPIYAINGKLIIKTEKPTSTSGNARFDDIFMMSNSTQSIGDQIEVIKSSSLASRVVRKLNLQTSYFNIGNIRTVQLAETEMPFLVAFERIKDSTAELSVPITILNESEYYLNNNLERKYRFNELVNIGGFGFRVVKGNNLLDNFKSLNFIVKWSGLQNASRRLASSISVVQVGELRSNVLLISHENENRKLGVSIVDSYILAYQDLSLEEKQEAAFSTLDFIDDQLKVVQTDLGTVENNLKTFRERNNLINIEGQSTNFITLQTENEKAIIDLEVKIKLVEYLSRFISSRENYFRTVQIAMGIEEPSLLQSISEYNSLQLRRETSLLTLPSTSPAIRELETAIAKLREDIISILKNVRAGYDVSLKELQGRNNQNAGEIKNIPSKEKQFIEILRQQKIMEELYSFLLRKKLETSIGAASSLSNIKMLEPATASGAPIRPKPMSIYIMSLLLGGLIPIAIIYLIELLNDKVRSKSDVERMTNTPILSEVGHSEGSNTLVVVHGNRKFVAEQFRIIRSNLQYILIENQKPTILVTSSYSGEGKSFISTNLGAVMAVSGKKTVILEFDIRKPKIMEGLKLKARYGITNFVIGNLNVDDIIVPIEGNENLFVIPCGPIPPNPAELLLHPRITFLFEELKKKFDVVIIDSAPVGLVSDAITLSKFADATTFIVRHNYTMRKQLRLVDDLYKNQKLPRLSIIINDIDIKSGYYGYGNYGYGYGYGYAYFEGEQDGKRRKKGILNSLRKNRKK